MGISLKEIKEMKPKEICNHKIDDLSIEAFEYVNDKYSMNSCDKCGQMCLAEELEWLNDEAFCELCN